MPVAVLPWDKSCRVRFHDPAAFGVVEAVHIVGPGQPGGFGFAEVCLRSVLVDGHHGRQLLPRCVIGHKEVGRDAIDRRVEEGIRQLSRVAHLQAGTARDSDPFQRIEVERDVGREVAE